MRIPQTKVEVPVAVLDDDVPAAVLDDDVPAAVLEDDEEVAPLTSRSFHPGAERRTNETVARRPLSRKSRKKIQQIATAVILGVFALGLLNFAARRFSKFLSQPDQRDENFVQESSSEDVEDESRFSGRLTDIETLRGAIAVPALPELGRWKQLEPSVVFQEVPLPGGTQPGFSGVLWLYKPAGASQARSLPCVMIACEPNAFLTGRKLAASDRGEHLPYVRAGFAVLAYEVDGVPRRSLDPDPPTSDFSNAVRKFAAARAGLVNAHVGLEFLLARVPQVNPNKIYTAGLGSAGTLAIHFAASDPRIKGCVAYSPIIDLEPHLQPGMKRWFQVTRNLDFLRFCSPRTYESNLNCPVMLFHAGNDLHVPVEPTVDCAARLQALGKPVTIKVGSGMEGHYVEMTKEGIPAGIEWLKNLAGN